MPTRANPIILATSLAILAALPPASAAAQDAQTTDAQTSEPETQETRRVVVLQGPAPLRSGDQEIFYTITEVPAGAVLTAAEESGRYTRVAYPQSIGAFVPAYSGTLNDSGDAVVLTEASRLRARSMLGGVEGSWSPVYLRKLPEGTELPLIEVIEDADAQVLAYRVEPPRPPQIDQLPGAYILTESIRDATQEDIDNAPDLSAPPVTIENDAQPETQPQPRPAAADAQPDTTTQPQNQTQDPEPVVIDNAPSERAPVSDELIDPIVLPDPASKGGPGAPLSVASIEALDAAFARARSMPRAQLDEALDELLAEHTRAIAAETDEALRASLEQRAAWLELRIDSRDQRRAIAATLASIDAQTQELSDRIERWDASRAYALVGRLGASTVYDGTNLPLLYRVRVPDPATGIERTAGYIDPSDVDNLSTMLGELVGVVGDPVRDDALAALVIRASRVERLGETPGD